jgi:hypothetical protein
MGATVVTSKTVAAFRNPKNGDVIYVLFEQSYEKNCYPHTPSWDCRAIGTFEQVFRRVFMSGSSCEGGSLQVRGGNTKPETYIKGWRICFSEPFCLDSWDHVPIRSWPLFKARHVLRTLHLPDFSPIFR